MYVICVTVKVKPDFVQQFIDASLLNQRGTRTTEPGNVRWDVLQAEDDPTRFFLYEAYHTKDDFTKHQQTQHYLSWKTAVQDWMAEPRVPVRHNSISMSEDVSKQ